jgi:lysophospholipase L1-like esterase
MGVRNYNTSAALNTSISGIYLGEGMARSDVNAVQRQQMADMAQFIVDNDAALAVVNPVEGSTFGRPLTIDFTSLYYGGETTVPNVLKIGSPTVSINSNKRLEVDALYTTTTNRAVLPTIVFGEGVLRVRLVRGKFMIVLVDQSFNGRAIWNDGTTNSNNALQYGGYPGSSGTVANWGTATTLAGVDGDVIWIELATGPCASGLAFQLRSWKDGNARPTSADYSGTYPAGAFPSGVVGTELNQGSVMVSSFSGATTKIEAIQAFTRGPQIEAQAAFIGRWHDRYEGFKIVKACMRGGSRMRFKCTGTTGVGIRWAIPIDYTNPPICSIWVNGVDTGNIFTFGGSPGPVQETTLISGLTTTQVYNVELRVRGVHENNDKWLHGSGLLIESLYPITSGGKIAPWVDSRNKFLFIGDSITEGIVARGTPTLPSNSAGDVSWPSLACDTLNLQPVINGFGGTGLTVAGSGGMPNADSNAFYYMKDRSIDTEAENIKYIAINLGVNDLAASVGTSAFQTAYVAFLAKLLKKYPSVFRIYAMRPFSGAYATQISAAVAAIGDPRVTYVDTSAWTGISTTDGTHPNLAGHVAAAAQLVAAVGTLQGSIF